MPAARRLAAEVSSEVIAKRFRKTWWRGDGRPANVAVDLAKELRELRKRGVVVDEHLYAACIDILGSRRRAKLSEQMHWNMVEAGVRPTARTYATLVRSFCKGDRCDRVPYIWFKMAESSVAPDADCFEALLEVYAKTGDAETAEETVDEMLEKGLEVRPQAYLSVAAAQRCVEDARRWTAKVGKSGDRALIEKVPIAELRACRNGKKPADAEAVFKAHTRACGTPELYCALADVYLDCDAPRDAVKVVRRAAADDITSRGLHERLLRAFLAIARKAPSSRASALVRLESEFTFHLDAAIDEFPEHAPLYEIGLHFYSHVVNPAAALALDKSWRGKGVKANYGLLTASEEVIPA
ncbi:Pentatricopeptide repeat-containing protein [Diplonema papillatum]|nr:Pentatricopeptide repeat-containing protein [Diplonema papillatum]